MAQPRSYSRQFNFTDFQTASPSAPLPAVQVDAELNTAKLTLDDLNNNIGLIQRDDGKLRNNSVHTEAFDATSLALMNAGEINPRGEWVAARSYAVNDLVNYNASTYLCLIAHTSTPNFLDDEAAGNWNLLANAAIKSTAAAVDKFEGDTTTVTFTLTYTYTSNTDVLVFVNGALRNPGDDYSISGNQITFVTAPSAPSVAGNENVIVWGPSVATQAAKDAAEAALDAFDDRYLGDKATAPTVDNDGNALITGSLYFDTVANVLFNWTGSAWERIKPTTAEQTAINTVHTNIADVNTVAGDTANINLLGPISTDISALAPASVRANMNTIVTNINNVNTVSNLLGTTHFAVTVSSFAPTVYYTVTVANVSGVNKFVLNGANAPALSLVQGQTVVFDVSDATNSGHPLSFQDSGGSTFSSTSFGTAGTSGATVTLVVPTSGTMPASYICTVHGAGMGSTIATTTSGGTNKFYLNGVEAPTLTLNRGFTYTFDVSDASNSGHPLRFKNGAASYLNGLTFTGTAGTANAKVEFIVPANSPLTGLRYYCTQHGNGMGNTITTQDNPINVVASDSADIQIVASNISTIGQKATLDDVIALSIALGG